jgi:hypothetical protein
MDSVSSTENDLFCKTLEGFMLDDVATEVYVEKATSLIAALGSRDNPNEFAPRWYRSLCKARFDVILSAMLRFSVECGGNEDGRGERSKRYVACAIIASTRGTKDLDDTHRALSELVLIWFANLLWMCECFALFFCAGSTDIAMPWKSGEIVPTRL